MLPNDAFPCIVSGPLTFIDQRRAVGAPGLMPVQLTYCEAWILQVCLIPMKNAPRSVDYLMSCTNMSTVCVTVDENTAHGIGIIPGSDRGPGYDFGAEQASLELMPKAELHEDFLQKGVRHELGRSAWHYNQWERCTMAIRVETAMAIEAFVSGRASAEDLESWILEIEDDDSFSVDERDSLTRLRLLLLEVGEGQRPLSSAVVEAWQMLSPSTTFVQASAASATTRYEEGALNSSFQVAGATGT